MNDVEPIIVFGEAEVDIMGCEFAVWWNILDSRGYLVNTDDVGIGILESHFDSPGITSCELGLDEVRTTYQAPLP